MSTGCSHSDSTAAIRETPLAVTETKIAGKLHRAKSWQRRQVHVQARQFVLQESAVEASIVGSHDPPRQTIEHLA
jgi:hypothetical protein